jgi:hypothetical protein
MAQACHSIPVNAVEYLSPSPSMTAFVEFMNGGKHLGFMCRHVEVVTMYEKGWLVRSAFIWDSRKLLRIQIAFFGHWKMEICVSKMVW